MDAVRGGGARAIIGTVGKIQENNNAVNAEIGANLDEQQKDIDKLKAEDNRRIQGVNEKRYQDDVAGLSSQIDSANDSKNQSIANTVQGLSDVGNSLSPTTAKIDATTTPNSVVTKKLATRGIRNPRYGV
jgi:hypothetical protein